MPKVSVIMTVYNGERYLQEAVDSILVQTFKDFEFIIVDDGSTDNTAEVLADCKDPRIKVVKQEHQGMAQGRNRGVEEACGEYIAIMDADDVSLPERLEVLADFLDQRKDVGGVSTGSLLANEHGEVTGIRGGIDSKEILERPRCPCEPAYMIRNTMQGKSLAKLT